MTLTAELLAQLRWVQTGVLDLATQTDSSQLEYDVSLAAGTGDGQVDKLFHDQDTVAAGTPDDLDLTNLAMSFFGESVAISFSKVKAILIVNRNTGAGENLLVGGAGAAAFSAPWNDDDDAVNEVPPNSCLMLVNREAGWAVTDSTADTLRIASASGTITYDVVVLGVE